MRRETLGPTPKDSNEDRVEVLLSLGEVTAAEMTGQTKLALIQLIARPRNPRRLASGSRNARKL